MFRHPMVPDAMHQHRLVSLAALALCLVLLPARLAATTVVPPQFDSLVAQADTVVHSVVKAVSSEWQENQGHRNIVTHVTLEVREVVTGSAPQILVLQALGGKVGDDELVVEGAPQFQVGDEDILFVHGNGIQFSPLVGVMYGRYPVVHDAATKQDYIARNNGAALYSVQEVSLPLEKAQTHAANAMPLTKAEFIRCIRQSHQVVNAPQKQL
jgi:hypothetical protein